MMLQFKQDDTTATLILTLSELQTIPDAYYLFVFTHLTTKDVIAFVKAQTDDQSAYTDRHNDFIIEPVTLFAGFPTGQWNYVVYEQASSTNTDTTLTGDPLEYGKIILDRATDFAFAGYEPATTYKGYDGN